MFGLAPEVLRWIDERVSAESRTLETGCGLSTAMFARAGADHTCVVPAASEIAALRVWASERDISLDRVRFVEAPSDQVLPTLDLGELDLVLVDGSHSFPVPFIDWYYTEKALKVGGTMVIDDTQIWTGRVLRDFLRGEPGWTTAEEWPARSVAFTKGAEAKAARMWKRQPYVAKHSPDGLRGSAYRALETLKIDGPRALLDRIKQSRGR